MFIPLYDANALRHIQAQYVTISLIVTNVAVWLVSGFLSTEAFQNELLIGLGYIPAVAFGYGALDPTLVIAPDYATYITYAFLHGSFWHLASNMVFLWVFGDNVEDSLGHVRFLIFYLLCAAAGAFVHGLTAPHSEGPLVGASGAIAGVVAAYMILHPKVRLWILVLMRIPIPLPAIVPLALWIGYQFLMLLIDNESNVSWGAHAGGILAGAGLVVIMRRPGVPLFDRTLQTPKAVAHVEAAESRARVVAEARLPKTIRWGRQ
ncbi:rhomboid family intramembrane serine protease [Rhizobium sp. NRK18]|uniref:rhomboid family intramembrane serine protease n=1 Tax=Rhizobium sp. NRK18 TaxID=2964667 RepID=UPI0021C39395|nr:rhomboid family intramembrane serine protease [Rhizobium sp. NRK18]MCQ2003084.1 rhomboid family intramembrane serine protease [Rhizobium sp. NRK18]